MVRWLLLALCMGALLIPRADLSALAVMVLSVPVALTGVRQRDQTFRWWAVYVLAFTAFARLRDLADLLLPPQVLYPIVLDRLLALGMVPTLALQRWHTPGQAAWWDYGAIAMYLTHYVAFPVVGLILWHRRPEVLRPYLLGMTWLLGISVVLHFILPTAPPWIAGQLGALPPVHKPVTTIFEGLAPSMYQYGMAVAGGNAVAAMPSVHMGAATFVALAARGTRWNVPGWSYAFGMGLSLIYLGEHYMVDVLVGAILAVYCFRRAVDNWGQTPSSPTTTSD